MDAVTNITPVLPFAVAAVEKDPRRVAHGKWLGHRPRTLVTNGANSRLPNALFNDIEPCWYSQREKPIHREITALVMQGYTVKEAATATGVTKQTASNAIRQPYARKRMIEEAQRTVSDEIKNFLEGEVLPSLQVLKTIRDDPNAKPADRAAASERLLDRALGRATQPLTIGAPSKSVKEMTDAELDAAIAESTSTT